MDQPLGTQGLTENYFVDLYIFTNKVCYPK